MLAAVVGLILSVSAAQAECEIIDDAGLYQTRQQQAILLMQYEDSVVRATGGKIRCTEDAKNARQICRVEGPGEMLVDTGTDQLVVRLTGSDTQEVHLSKTGDVTCGS